MKYVLFKFYDGVMEWNAEYCKAAVPDDFNEEDNFYNYVGDAFNDYLAETLADPQSYSDNYPDEEDYDDYDEYIEVVTEMENDLRETLDIYFEGYITKEEYEYKDTEWTV